MATRQYVLERLKAERRAAADAFEYGRVAELDAQIERLSSESQPVNPAQETTAALRRRTSRSTRVVRK